jgi:hypothetical protein
MVGLSLGVRLAEAQRPEPRVFRNAPAARWVAHPTAPGEEYGVFHFRRTFDLAAAPERLVVHVSADNRYGLFVNGRPVSSGPQRSDLLHWRYETLDLAPHLRAGRDVLAALVWSWGRHRLVAQFRRRTALLLQGDTEREAVVNTGPEWKVLHNEGYRPDGGERRVHHRDTPAGNLYSQQTNIMAVLADAVPAAEQRAVMERVLSDKALIQATYYFGFYLFEALAKAGLADQYVERLAPWKGMLSMGLTTTPENPEPTRSDSHAWSAHPNYGLLATVLGVGPDGPGWRSVRIAPALGPPQRASGRIPQPRGEIDVTLARSGAAGLRAEVTLPPGVAGRFLWRGREVPLREGRQVLDLKRARA